MIFINKLLFEIILDFRLKAKIEKIVLFIKRNHNEQFVLENFVPLPILFVLMDNLMV